jgi:transcriptional regulator with XRE-family HTH domain
VPVGRYVSNDDPDAWERVAERVRIRRESLGLKVRDLAEPSASTWSILENGHKTTYLASKMRAVCRSLRWTEDSVERLLEGLEPVEAEPSVAVELAEVLARFEAIESRLSRIEARLDAHR